IEHLHGLTHLEYLNLYGTTVSEASVQALGQLRELKQLYVWQTQLTDDGLAQLRKLLPDAAVISSVSLPSPDELVGPKPGPNNLPTFATGRFVRVELPGEGKWLQLAEVEIFAADSEEPLQTQGHAAQSTTALGADAARAADGKTNQEFQEHSVAHTEQESNPWWEIDLKQPHAIGRIRLWNRGDCCGERLAGARLLVLDNQRQTVFAADIKDPKTSSWHEFP
ncbi:MAG TPA: discoidin domain-containing protein, partial [Pirellulaceae bacterium]